MMTICDLHSHILPGMDDGSLDAEMSLNMLRAAGRQGVWQIAATPHYYPVESVSDFLARRCAAEKALREAINTSGEQLPRVVVGAEVAYRPGIGYEEDLHRLCIGGTEYLLLELPFAPWGSEVVRDICNMACARGITPILAHLERYLKFQKKKTLENVLAQGVLVQMNAEALLERRTRTKALKMLKSGNVHLLGSDCHNMTTRKPNLGEAVAQLSQWGMTGLVERIEFISTEILEQAESL